MGRIDYLTMRREAESAALLDTDWNELKLAATKLFNHASQLGGFAFGTSFLKWLASFSAMSDSLIDYTHMDRSVHIIKFHAC